MPDTRIACTCFCDDDFVGRYLWKVETHDLNMFFQIFEILMTAFPIPLASLVHQDALTNLIEVVDQVEANLFQDGKSFIQGSK